MGSQRVGHNWATFIKCLRWMANSFGIIWIRLGCHGEILVKMLHKLNIKYMPIFTNISPWHPNLIHIIPKLFAICLRHFMKVTQLCPTLCDPMDYSPWNSPGHNTGVGYLSLLQGIFLTQELSWGLLHCRWILFQLSQKGSPGILEWVAYPFSSRSSQPRNWTGVSCTAGRFFTNWTLRELSAI